MVPGGAWQYLFELETRGVDVPGGWMYLVDTHPLTVWHPSPLNQVPHRPAVVCGHVCGAGHLL